MKIYYCTWCRKTPSIVYIEFWIKCGVEEIKGHLNLLERMGVHSYDAMLFMLLVNFCCGHTLLLPTRVNNVLLTIIFTYNGPNNGNQNSTLVQLNIAP